MKQFDERLQQLQQQMSRRTQLTAQMESLGMQLEEQKRKVQQLQEAANSEQYDVTELESLSFASILARIAGNLDEKLNREKKEAFAAAARYESARRELENIQADIRALANELHGLESVESEYKQVLKEKRQALADGGDETAKEILDLEQRIAWLNAQKAELDEAYEAGSDAMDIVKSISGSLSSASGWATWDLFGGGLLTDIIKHSHMNDAQQEIGNLQNALRRFRTELADVKIDDDLDFQMDGFTSFGDWFLDGIIFDWMALDHIHKSETQIQNTWNQIAMAISKLQDMQEAVNVEIREIQAQLDQLTAQA
ncbi:MAG: hypothetical protein IKU09_10855 [Firmicutes bacterium]|nr:hypothetical protein [Bacillota bacterium]